MSSVYGIDDCFTGSKDGELGPIADMAVYKNKMGGGCIDALKLLFAVKGTPAVYVRTGEPVTVDFARYFGGDRSRVALTAASFASPGNLGLSSSKAVFDGTKITFDCPEPGTSMLRISAVSAIRSSCANSPSFPVPDWPPTADGFDRLSSPVCPAAVPCGAAVFRLY